MHPADATPADLCPEHIDCEDLDGELQGPITSTESAKTVLLLDGDERHRQSLVRSLQEGGYRVIADNSLFEESPQILDAALREADLVLFDMTVMNHHARDKLAQVEAFRRRNGLKPDIAVRSPNYGPEVQHFLEYILMAREVLYEG
jgi:CheY-like chemotaxis protein